MLTIKVIKFVLRDWVFKKVAINTEETIIQLSAKIA